MQYRKGVFFTRVKSLEKPKYCDCGNNRGHKIGHKKTQLPVL